MSDEPNTEGDVDFITVTWPVPLDTSLEGAIRNIMAIIRGQNPKHIVTIVSICSSEHRFEGKEIADAKARIYIDLVPKVTVPPDYFQIELSLMKKK